MKLNIKNAFFLFLISIPSTLFSQVQDTLLLRKIINELNIKENEIHMDLVVDKVLPNSKEKTIVVIPKYRTNEKDEYGNYFYEFDSYIIIANNRNGKILNKFYEPNAWTSDAINLTSIGIDTGLYILNDQTRAFAIRVGYTGSSRPNPYNKIELSLFIPDNNSLKKILKDYPIDDFIGEWDTNCSGEFEETKSIIEIDKSKTNNFNNLIIKTKITKILSIPTKNDCLEKKQTSQRSTKLKFNRNNYQ